MIRSDTGAEREGRLQGLMDRPRCALHERPPLFRRPPGAGKLGSAAASHKDSRRRPWLAFLAFGPVFLTILAVAGPARADPLSRFLDGLWKSEPPPAAPVAAPPPAPPPARPKAKPALAAKPKPAAAQNAALPAAGKPVADAAPKPVAAKPVPQKPVPAAAAPPAAKPLAAKPAPVKPVATAAADPSVPIAKPVPLAPVPQAVAVQPAAASIPTTPQAAISG